MAKYDGLLGQPLLEVEEPDKEGGITLIFKDNRYMFIKIQDGKIVTQSLKIIKLSQYVLHLVESQMICYKFQDISKMEIKKMQINLQPN